MKDFKSADKLNKDTKIGTENNMNKFLFPFDNLRTCQTDFMNTYFDALKNKKNLIISAPTGVGKTVAALSPAITYALENKKKVFFLTSRTTQHKAVIDTIKLIQNKFGKKIIVLDLIGKKWMCNQPNAQIMNNGEFSNFCKLHRETGSCKYFTNLKNKSEFSNLTKNALTELKQKSPLDVNESIKIIYGYNLCNYEVSTLLGSDANVVIGDYFHLFNPSICSKLLKKSKIDIDDLLVIVDEAHNLPSRIKDLGSFSLNGLSLSRLQKILAQKLFNSELELVDNIFTGLQNYMEHNLIRHRIEELEITKNDLYDLIEKSTKLSYDQIIDTLIELDKKFDEPKHKSVLQNLIDFLLEWEIDKQGYIRILNYSELGSKKLFKFSFACLDSSIICKELINSVHSTLMMSATLNPTSMYKDLLGFSDDVILKEYETTFSNNNRLNLIIPETSSRYTMRTETNFKKIGEHISNLLNNIPGNVSIFFPSYKFKDMVAPYFQYKNNKPIFNEFPGMTKVDRSDLIKNFISYKEIGAVLLAVSNGSFAEGIDLPGDQLQGVIIVGLPLGTPNLITKRTIDFYQKKYGQGWNYGYIYPAMSKTIQSAGRCIRTESDRGVIIFIDERYIHSNYYSCFPNDWHIKISKEYTELVNSFFKIK